MPLNEARKQEMQQEIAADIETFLKEHPGETFYAFGFDFNASEAEILLCFNTEEAHAETLKEYKVGSEDDKRFYESSEQHATELRFGMGEWKYQGTNVYYICDEEEKEKISDDDEDNDYENAKKAFMDFAYDLLLAVCRTPAYQAIPKTDNFRVVLSEHDEHIVDDTVPRIDRLMADIAKYSMQ